MCVTEIFAVLRRYMAMTGSSLPTFLYRDRSQKSQSVKFEVLRVVLKIQAVCYMILGQFIPVLPINMTSYST